MHRFSFRALAIGAMACASFAAHALEYPIGTPQQRFGMEIAAVYLQPVEMEPDGMMRGAADSDFPEVGAVARIRQPTLLLAWEGDDGHPLSTAEKLAELLPDATLSVARNLQELGAWPRRVAGFCARQSA